MTISRSLLVAAVTLVLSGPTLAQVYKSKDAEGNAVYSDTPSPGAKQMDIQEPNVAESIDVPEPAPAPAPEVITEKVEEERDAPADLQRVVVINDDEKDGRERVDDRPTIQPIDADGEPGHGAATAKPRPAVRPRAGGGQR
jgi:hypothetical protein